MVKLSALTKYMEFHMLKLVDEERLITQVLDIVVLLKRMLQLLLSAYIIAFDTLV
jgi:hypothetical protein